MTLVLAAPRADDDYYAPVYDGILAFQLDYARAIAAHDDAVILVDDAAYDFFARHLPDEMLLPWPMADIWARDYSPVFATAPLAFR
ncbi:MAG: agmatine deiminase family protein, partial [Kiloniellales bacterium]|nr:agmatine deiminase family protein [Kiloniellales bacterium]